MALDIFEFHDIIIDASGIRRYIHRFGDFSAYVYINPITHAYLDIYRNCPIDSFEQALYFAKLNSSKDFGYDANGSLTTDWP